MISYHSLSAMPVYAHKSSEELRWDDTQRAGPAGLSSTNLTFLIPSEQTADTLLASAFEALQSQLSQHVRTVQASLRGVLVKEREARSTLEAQLTAEKELSEQLMQSLERQPSEHVPVAAAASDSARTLQQRYLQALEADEQREQGAPGVLTIAQLEIAVGRVQAVIQAKRQRERRETADRWICKVCYDLAIDVQLLPCRHVVCCAPCADKLDKCPLCRAEVTSRAALMVG